MNPTAPMLAAYNAICALLPTCPEHLMGETLAALHALSAELYPPDVGDEFFDDGYYFDEDYEPPAPERVHGVSGAHAMVTRSITRGRRSFGSRREIPAMKRRVRRQHRRAWKVWARDPEQAEPQLRSLTSWAIW